MQLRLYMQAGLSAAAACKSMSIRQDVKVRCAQSITVELTMQPWVTLDLNSCRSWT